MFLIKRNRATMQKDTLIEAIKQILISDIPTANISAFSPTARLNQDLYLDSVLVMQLLISLELKLSIQVPDESLNAHDFETIDSLSESLLQKISPDLDTQIHDKATQIPTNEDFEDIKVHCFVSCLSECIKAHPNVDHRPFYFGVWDADIVITQDYKIHYHADNLNHDFFRYWFNRLYSVQVTPWYQTNQSKAQNIACLLNLIEHKTASQNIMVMLDMFLLPERENKFNQNPFPHYVMLEKSDNTDNLFMWDPDFRWQGEQNKQQVLTAIASDAVAGGYLFDSQEITASSHQAIYEYFIACLKLNSNPMTEAVRTIIQAHLQSQDNLNIQALDKALANLPVLAIRKYAYEHGLAFFMIELKMDFDEFEHWCEIIEQLVSGYKQIQYRAMKIAAHADHKPLLAELTKEINELLTLQDEREFAIKRRLASLFNQWTKQAQLHLKQEVVEVFV